MTWSCVTRTMTFSPAEKEEMHAFGKAGDY